MLILILINVQYSHKAVFSFEKDLNLGFLVLNKSSRGAGVFTIISKAKGSPYERLIKIACREKGSTLKNGNFLLVISFYQFSKSV